MKCPQCSHIDTRITDSRLSRDDMIVRRRRICENCNYRFTTAETREVLDVMVVKKSGIKERYSSDKLLKAVSIFIYCILTLASKLCPSSNHCFASLFTILSLATLLQSYGSIDEFKLYVNQPRTDYIR